MECRYCKKWCKDRAAESKHARCHCQLRPDRPLRKNASANAAKQHGMSARLVQLTRDADELRTQVKRLRSAYDRIQSAYKETRARNQVLELYQQHLSPALYVTTSMRQVSGNSSVQHIRASLENYPHAPEIIRGLLTRTFHLNSYFWLDMSGRACLVVSRESVPESVWSTLHDCVVMMCLRASRQSAIVYRSLDMMKAVRIVRDSSVDDVKMEVLSLLEAGLASQIGSLPQIASQKDGS